MTKKHKRNLFEELKQGIEEINAYETGKLTLRTYTAKQKPRPSIKARQLLMFKQQL